MQTISLTATALKAIAIAAADRDIQYYLNGVLIEATATETRIVATDGHRAAMFRMPAVNVVDTGCNFIIPLAAIKQVKASAKLALDSITVEIDDAGHHALVNGALRINFVPVDKRFPDYRRVIPRETTGELAQFNPDYLSDFAKMASMLRRARNVYPYVRHNGRGVALVSVQDLPDFVGVMLPIVHKENGRDLIVPEPNVWPAA